MGDTLLNIGDHLNQKNCHADAMELFAEAKGVYETLGWVKTLNFAVLLHNMGESCFKQGEQDKAAQHYTEAWEAYHGVVLGTDSPQYIALLEDMREAGMVIPDEPASPRL